eukprot:TRINITY_DN76544_c0_g1_i1.p1 TRINITY_DN76544_c0_g1~~TRINITY_DN76544_c0_g1_i1.p1  ORF type:complete len:219 (-),score=33.84 TRINITY_DN76544_c0_g1_i1:229-885(-)
MLARISQHMGLKAATRCPVRAQASRALPAVTYHGMVDKSMFDMQFKHILLQFPESLTSTSTSFANGSPFILKLVEHYEEDLFHDISENAVLASGTMHKNEDAVQINLDIQECSLVWLSEKSIISAKTEVSSEVTTLDDKNWPFSSKATMVINGLSSEGIPAYIELSMEAKRVGESQASQKEKYVLSPKTQTELAQEKAGVYPSGATAPFITEGILSKL